MKKEKIILIGGGGHCKSCLDIIYSTNKYEVEGIVDVKEKLGQKVLDSKIIACDADLPSLISPDTSFLITIGFIRSIDARMRIFEKLISLGARFASVVSPFAIVSEYSKIGYGTIVMHNSVINADAVIGNNCIINTKALIEHDAVIGDQCHVSTGAIINGGVKVGANSFIGSGTVTKEYINIPENSFIKANSLVTGK